MVRHRIGPSPRSVDILSAHQPADLSCLFLPYRLAISAPALPPSSYPSVRSFAAVFAPASPFINTAVHRTALHRALRTGGTAELGWRRDVLRECFTAWR